MGNNLVVSCVLTASRSVATEQEGRHTVGTQNQGRGVQNPTDYDPFELVFAPRRPLMNPTFDLSQDSWTGKVYGYARVSTTDQSLDHQIDALRQAGCEAIYTEKMSGARNDREQLKKLCYSLQPGDTVIVTRLSRVSRSSRDTMKLMDALAEVGVRFRTLNEAIDTATSTGKLFLAILASLAESDRENIVAATNAGLAAARARGKKGGRPPAIDTEKAKLILDYIDRMSLDIVRTAKLLDVSKRTIQRFLAEKKESDEAGNDDFYDKYRLTRAEVDTDIPSTPDPVAAEIR